MAEERINDQGETDARTAQPTVDGQGTPVRAASEPTTMTSGATDPSATTALPTTSADEHPTTTLPRPSDAKPGEPGATATMPPVAGASSVAPDYAAAAGETTVVSNAPSSDGQPTAQYRPAPEYGAYDPSAQAAQQNAANQQQANGQPTQPFGFFNGNPFVGGRNGQNGQNGQPQQNGQNASRNPFQNPFLAGQQNRQNQQGSQQNAANQQPQAQQGGNGGQFPPFGGTPSPAYGQNPYGQNPDGQNGQNGPFAPQTAAAKGGSRTAGTVVTAVVAALVAAALSLGVGYAAITGGWVKVPTTSSLANVNSNKSGSGSATAKSGEAVDWTAVAGDVSDSVVSIQTVMSDGTAKGSGAILDTEGHIITNNHVISGAQQIQVTLANGTIYSAQLVGADSTTDLAVLKLDNPPSDLKPVEFADSDDLAVGENVMAIGNPLGYDDTVTAGIVSALNRPVTVTDDDNNEIVTNAVQIDAAINPGNSGGPTFNAAGQVIGINSSIASTATSSSSAGSIGIGFAIPSNLVKRVANEIIENGSVKHVALGVTIQSATVEADGVTRGGAKIVTPSSGGSAVVSGGPADKAGLKADDTIVAFNGNAVNNNYSLLGYVRASALGDEVTLTIVRDGKTMDVDVTLDQEEASVNGSSSSSNSQNQQNQQNGGGSDGSDGSNGYGQNGYGQNGYGYGYDGGGLSDPFGLW